MRKTNSLLRMLIAGIFLVMLSTGILNATNYYVDPATGNMNNNGSESSPWSTLAEVFSAGKTFASGDVIYLKNGNHGFPNITQSNSGIVTIKSYQGHSPVINRLDMNGASNWTIEGVRVYTSAAPPEAPVLEHPVYGKFGNYLIRLTGCSYVTFDNCYVYSIENSGSWTADDWNYKAWCGIFLYTGSNNITVKNSLFKNLNFAIDMKSSTSNAIQYNTIQNFCGDGLRVSTNCLIEYNDILDGYLTNGNHGDAMQAFASSNATIRGNKIISTTSATRPFINYGLQGMGFFDGFFDNYVIENNLVVIHVWHGIALYGARNCRIVNNTVVDNPLSSSSFGPPWIAVYNHKNGSASSNNIMRNNITSDIGTVLGTSVSNNIETQSYTSHFVNYAGLDFRLLTTSSAINGGNPSLAPTVDLNQFPRSGNPDIGCYELGTTAPTPDSIAPSVPTGLTVGTVTSYSVALSWNASTDDVGVAGYKVYVNGANPVTSFANNTIVTGLSGSTTYTFAVSAYDAAGNESPQSASSGNVTTLEQTGVTSNSTFQSFTKSTQTGTFTATFDAVPYGNNIDAVTGIQNGTVSGYGDMACIIRFNSSGIIDARNGGSYTATNSVSYTAGVNYHFRLEIDVPSHVYSVYVTPDGGSEQTVASNFAFRSEQAGVSQLTGWSLYAYIGSHIVDNMIFSTGGGDIEAPSAPTGLVAGTVTETSVALSWTASTDNMGVTGYKVYTDGANPVSVTGTSATISGLTASTQYSFTVSAIDAADNESAQSSAIQVTTATPADTEAPSVPTGLAEGTVTENSVDLSWAASTDNVGVTGYKVYTDGSNPVSVTGTSATISGLTASTQYSFTVSAIDAEGNESAQSFALNVITLAPDVNSNLALNKPIIVSAYQDDSYGYKPGENLVDGDVSDDARWSASGFPQWAEIDLGANYDLNQIDLYPYQNRAYQYIVEAKPDGGSYTTIADKSANTESADLLVSVVDITARYVKITVSGLYGSSSTWVSLSELEVWGTTATQPDTQAPSVPTGLTAGTVTTSSVDLSWTASTDNVGVTSYKVYVDGSNPVSVTGTSATISGLSESTQYSFTVSAIDAAGNESAQSSAVQVTTATPPDTQAPSVPTGLAAGTITTSSVDLSWTASTDNVGVTGYKVYTDGTNPVSVTGTSVTISGLSASTQYSFTVSAVDAAGNESAQSSSVNVTTQTGIDPIAANIVGHWSLDELNGSITPDESGNGNDGVVTGATITTGQIDNALDFDGVNDKVSLGNLDVVPSSGNDGITLAAWINPDVWVSSSKDDRIISKATGTGEQDHYWMLSPLNTSGQARLRFRLKTGTTTTSLVSASGDIQLNTWTHVAATYNGSTMKVYINGSELGSVAKTGTIATNSSMEATIGINPDNLRPFNGQIDEVYVLDRALTTQEINDLMTRTSGGGGGDTESPSVPTGLTAGTVTTSSVDLSWVASTDNVGVIGYKVYTDGSNPVTVAGTSTTISGLSASTQYSFTVSAVDAAGNESAQSSALQVTTDTPPSDTEAPSVPTGLTAGTVTTSSVALSWTASTDNVGVTGYKVYTDGANPQTATGTNATISGLSASTQYSFTVSAVDAAGNESAQSSALQVTTDTPPSDTEAPSVPTGLTAGTVTSSSVALSWTASIDNVGVTGYKVYTDGSNPQTVTGTSATINGLSESTQYSFTVSAIDAAGNESAQSSAIQVTTQQAPSGITSNTTWQSFQVSTQTGMFTATFDAVPNGSNIDAVTGIQNGTATTYGSLACIARFNSSGQIDARNGATYMASNTINYTAGTNYHFRLEINVSTHTYFVYVTPQGGTEQTVASNFAFRSEQANVAQLTGWSLYALSGSHTVSNVVFTPAAPDTEAPSVPTGLTSSNITSVSFTLSWASSTDNVGVTGYEVFQDGVSLGVTGNTSLIVSGLSGSATYSMTVSAYDGTGNESAQSAALNVTTDVPDTQAPSVPTGLASSNISSSSFILSWNASTDNTGVTGYEVFKDGASIGTTTQTTMFVGGLNASTTYSMTVRASDITPNWSAPSAALNVTTLEPSGDWPNASNTGTSGTLTSSGTITVTQNGALIQNMNVSGDIEVKANNVTIRNCKFNRLWLNISGADNYTGIVVEDCEMYWAGQRNFTLRRCELRSVTDDLVRISGGNVLIEDCYLHIDGPLDPATHADAIQSYPVPTHNSVIRHNTIYNAMVQTSCVNAQDVTLDNNLFAGGGYVLYQSNMRVINNHFSTVFFPNCGKWNILYPSDTPAEWSGNVWHETGVPIPNYHSAIVEEEVALKETGVNQDVKLYPNPVNGGGILYIQLSDYNAGMANINIVDLAGRSVYNKLHTIEQSEMKISLDNLVKGVYIISINGNGINKQQKLIVE